MRLICDRRTDEQRAREVGGDDFDTKPTPSGFAPARQFQAVFARVDAPSVGSLHTHQDSQVNLNRQKDYTLKHKSSLIGLVLALGTAVTCSAVTLGQIDTFEDGTTQNWVAGLLGSPHPAPPVNVASGGPNGANDHYLLVTSLGGLGPGSRLSVISFLNQWAGNYIAAGVTSISMDVRNFGPSDLYLRLGFSDPLAGPPANAAFSDVAVFLPAGGDWTSIVFSLALPGLGVEAGDREEALKNTTELRIYSSQPARFPNPASPIPAVNAVLGIDNIRAPEAGSTALLLGLATGMIGILQGWPQIRRGLAGRKRAFPLRSMA